ncbi:hypothetical protein BGX27_006543 [Mortierella sp. AM989]|nr:hypothetical protein BGX27_006543 [Mortierella sp. AM989]
MSCQDHNSELLKSRVPKSKVQLQKKVIDIIQDDHGVVCKCVDRSEFWSDILVGTDGAHSKVRERMYQQLYSLNMLPMSDAEPLKLTHLYVLGVSKPLDPAMFSNVKDKFSKV